MKNKAKELDVDFIGGQGPLTKDEEQSISEYLKKQKLVKKKNKVNTSKDSRPKSTTT